MRFFFYGLFLVFVFAGLVGGSLYLLSRPGVIIQTIILEGTVTVADSELQNLVKKKLEGKYFLLFPRSSIFFYPRGSIKTEILTSFKIIEEVEIGFDSLRSIYIRIEEREPQLLYCGENRLLEGTPECYFVDEKGVIYTKAPSFTEDVYFRIFSSLNAGDTIGQSLLPEKKFRELSFFLSSLQASDITPIALSILDEKDYELYLEGGVRILFLRSLDFAITLDNLRSVFSSDELKNQAELGLDYVDLRFGNKVYYKLLVE